MDAGNGSAAAAVSAVKTNQAVMPKNHLTRARSACLRMAAIVGGEAAESNVFLRGGPFHLAFVKTPWRRRYNVAASSTGNIRVSANSTSVK
jgi:hypothetical protein